MSLAWARLSVQAWIFFVAGEVAARARTPSRIIGVQEIAIGGRKRIADEGLRVGKNFVRHIGGVLTRGVMNRGQQVLLAFVMF